MLIIVHHFYNHEKKQFALWALPDLGHPASYGGSTMTRRGATFCLLKVRNFSVELAGSFPRRRR
jgi:hypothetical protein